VGGTAFVAGDFDLISERVAQDARLAAIIRSTESTHERWSATNLLPATDDWPYLYLPGRGIPILYFFMFGALLLVSLLGIRSAFGQWRTIEWRFFFLGAGFLLLEVQNISKLALLFGTTWTVNVVVISAVLATIFLANALTARVSVRSSPVLYLTLFASLLINLALPITVFAEAPAGLKELLVGVVMGLPFFFAGMIFSSAFAQAPDRPSALASNLLGAMVGGMLEALSFVLGVKALLVVALALYMLALASGRLRMAQKV
jgi:hypothetical protein